LILKNFIKNFINSLIQTNNPEIKFCGGVFGEFNPKFSMWGTNYILYGNFWSITDYYKSTNFFLNIKLLNEYNSKFSDHDLYVYINAINYINTNYTYIKGKYKNIYALLMYTPVFIKNIPSYNNIIYNKLSNINNLLNIIFFNLKWILIASIISIIYFYISLFYIQIDIAKQITLWYILFILYYLLMSTFNSFLIKYKYGKFTSAIQRFWKRTGMVFWLIEGFLFLLFFYYFLNSSQEPLYMFDYSSLNQELLIQLKITFKNLLLLSLAIYLSFILIFNLNYLNYFQNLFILLLILLIIFYSLYIESYQFIYIISLYADKFWLFEDISQSWSLEIEENNLRVKQQYFVYCLIAKYWHFIFIFISWFFFFIKSIEIKKINYTMLGYNTQNLLILYVLNILCLIQWIKYLSKKFLEITYYWFHIQYDEKLLNNFFFEIFNIIFSLFNVNSIKINIEKLFILSNRILYIDNINLWKFI